MPSKKLNGAPEAPVEGRKSPSLHAESSRFEVTFTTENGAVIENIVGEGTDVHRTESREAQPPAFVPVTYTTKSGEVVVTKKVLCHQPTIKLSQTPGAPQLGVAILGYRRFGRKHLKDVFDNPACRVRFVVDDDPQLIQQAKSDLAAMGMHGCDVLSDYSQVKKIVESNLVHLIIVSSKQDCKKEFVTAALKANKVCMCDKPLAMTSEGVRELFALARDNKTILLTNLPGRPGKAFTPVVMSLISSSSQINVERLKTPNARGADHSSAPKIDINNEATAAMLIDVAMHDAFAINFCMCMRPISVAASVLPATPNVCEVTLQYPNGCKISIKSSYGQEEQDVQQFTLFGERLSDMRRVDHMNMCDMHKGVEGFFETSPNDVKGIRFTQVYDNSNRDALEQCYAFSSGHKELALRVRPHLMEQNILDCLIIADAALHSIRSDGTAVPVAYW